MDWLFPATVVLWGAYLVWKVDKLEAKVRELQSTPLRLENQLASIASLEHRIDQLEGRSETSEKNFDRRLHDLEYPASTPAQREAMRASFEKIDEQIRQELERREREGEP